MTDRADRLPAELDAFYLEPTCCGDLRLESEPSDRCVIVSCLCGALTVRPVDEASERPGGA